MATTFHGSAPPSEDVGSLRQFLGVFRYGRRAIDLVWSTSRALTTTFALLTALGGVIPAGIAFVGQKIVDAVVAAASQANPDLDQVLFWVGVEAGLVVAMGAVQRGISVCQSLLRARLGHRVNTLILEKAVELSLEQFEDSEFYDKLTRARRQASARPLSLVNRTFGLVQNAISLVSYAVLLFALSPWAVAVLLIGGLPSFFVEAKFSGDAFRLFRWRSPETRKQMYLETLLAREDYTKEVKLYGLGSLFLQRYREIFQLLFGEDRKLTLRRGAWGFALGLVSTAAFYGAYAWIAWEAAHARITLGEMTMYLLLFKQGQSAVGASLTSISGMYEDNLYLSNLYEYLEQPTPTGTGEAKEGPLPGDGVRFEGVSFTYPGSKQPALQDIDLHLRPGEALALVGENGSGKTTLIKLLTRLYAPSKGVVKLDGLDLREWDEDTLRERVAVVFQDFSRYQLTVGENVGAGDVERFDDQPGWEDAAQRGLAAPFIEEFEKGYLTQLGRWFADGRELSGGQWQKIALSRAFMRRDADLLVLDEPTAALDAEAEAKIFEHVRNLTSDKMAILISHRFSTVRMADHIVVLELGKVRERGSHAELMQAGGVYQRLFELQAEGYR